MKTPVQKNQFEFILDLIKTRKCALFFGSGISRNSNLPTVYDILDCLLNTIGYNHSDLILRRLSKIQFEYFISQLAKAVDIKKLLSLFSLGTPNENHHFFASLAKADLVTTFITTNFDCLLEQAFSEAAVSFKRVYKKNELLNPQFNNQSINLFKLHGTIDEIDSVNVTIEAVANYSQRELLSSFLQEFIHTSSTKQILFLGYSRSDRFDIEPALISCIDNGIKLIQWEHSNSSYSKAEIKFDDSYFNRPELIFDGDTNELVAALSYELGLSISDIRSNNPVDFQSIIKTWWDDLKNQEQLGVLAVVARLCGNYCDSKYYLKESHNESLKNNDVQYAAIQSCNLGISSLFAQSYDEALDHLDSAIASKVASRHVLLTIKLARIDCLIRLKRFEEAAHDVFFAYQDLKGTPFLKKGSVFEPEAHFWVILFSSHAAVYKSLDENIIKMHGLKNEVDCIVRAIKTNEPAIEIAEKGGYLGHLLEATLLQSQLFNLLGIKTSTIGYIEQGSQFLSWAKQLKNALLPESGWGDFDFRQFEHFQNVARLIVLREKKSEDDEEYKQLAIQVFLDNDQLLKYHENLKSGPISKA